MTFFHIALVVGPVLAALLVLHHIASVKVDNEAILSAYRDLRREGRRRGTTGQPENPVTQSPGSTDPVSS